MVPNSERRHRIAAPEIGPTKRALTAYLRQLLEDQEGLLEAELCFKLLF